MISGHLPSRGSGIRVAGGQGFGWTARPGPRGGSLGFPAGPAGVAPRRPSFRWGIPGGVPATGAGRGGAGAGPGRDRSPPIRGNARQPWPPAFALSPDSGTMAPARLLALLWPLVGALAVAAESVGPGRSPGGRTGASFVPGILRCGGNGEGDAPPPARRRGQGHFVGNLAPGSQGGSGERGVGGPPARRAPPACCASRLPLASAPPRAQGSDVTKLVSPRFPSPSRPFPGDPGAGSEP